MPQQPEPQQQTQAQPAANAAARGGGTRKTHRGATLRGGPCVSVSDDRCGADECYCVFTSESEAADDEGRQSPQRPRGAEADERMAAVQEGDEEDL